MNEETTELKFISRFGVGCAQFCPKKSDEKFSNFEDYIEKLESSLATIAAIQDVEVHGLSDLNFKDKFPGPFPRLSKGKFPFLAGSAGVFLDINMRIAIPVRTQRAILEVGDHPDWLPFDEILVMILYQYYLPIFIVSLHSKSSSDPSSCVRLVKEFLKDEMDNNANCNFTLDILGPTPFHADFEIYEPFDQQRDKIFERHVRYGYDYVRFFFASESAFDEYLQHDLAPALDCFYFIVMEAKQTMQAWDSCFGKIAGFLERRQKWSRLRRFVDLLMPSFNIFDSVSAIARFRLRTVSVGAGIQSMILGHPLLRSSPIWPYVKREQRTFPQYDIESLERLVDYLDRRQARHQIIVNALMAAVVGGIVSALVRLWTK